MLLRQFQSTPDFGDSGSKENSFEMRMLEWCRTVLAGYEDITITGWDSFQNGKALLGLVEQFDPSLLHYKDFDKSDPLRNAKAALQIAEDKIKIPQELIDPEELVSGQISDKNLVLYMTLFYNAFSDKDSLSSRESLVRRLHQLEEQIETVLNEKDSLELRKKSLEETRFNLTNGLNLTTSERDELLKWKELNEEEWAREKKAMLERIAELEENINMLQSVSTDSTSKLKSNNEKIKNENEELMKGLDRLKGEVQVLEEKLNSLHKNFNEEKKEREKLEGQIQKIQNETGLNLATLRKRLQAYVWEDMYVWKVLLDMKVDFSLEDFHAEKLNEIGDLDFEGQIDKIKGQILEENARLVELAAERVRESQAAKNELMLGEDDDDVQIQTSGKADTEKVEKTDKVRKDKRKKKN